MQSTIVTSDAAISLPIPFWKSSNGRAAICGVCVALVASGAMAISARSTSQVVTPVVVSSIEGNAIVEFDSPAHSAMNPNYRVDCSIAGSKNAGVSAQSNISPVVVAGLDAGQKYDCRASLTADAGTIKSVRVRVVGQE